MHIWTQWRLTFGSVSLPLYCKYIYNRKSTGGDQSSDPLDLEKQVDIERYDAPCHLTCTWIADGAMGSVCIQSAVFTYKHIHTNRFGSTNANSDWDKHVKDQRAASRKERGVKKRVALSIWNLHWGAASSNSMGLCGELLSVGSMGGQDRGGEDRMGGWKTCGGSRAGERGGLGGAG